jgi:hypothetical protein
MLKILIPESDQTNNGLSDIRYVRSFWWPWSRCPDLAVLSYPVLSVCSGSLSWLPCPECPVLTVTVLLWLSSFGCPVLAVLFLHGSLCRKTVLWSRNYLFPLRLRLSKCFGSGSRSGSGNSFGTTCYHRFYIKKYIFHVF